MEVKKKKKGLNRPFSIFFPSLSRLTNMRLCKTSKMQKKKTQIKKTIKKKQLKKNKCKLKTS